MSTTRGETTTRLRGRLAGAARRGVGRGHIDSTAGVIRLLERAEWASKVRWPTEEQIAAASTA